MPDALSKTVPIWCAIVNRAVKARFRKDDTWDVALYTPPGTVSAQEHAQISARLHSWSQSLLVSTLTSLSALPLAQTCPRTRRIRYQTLRTRCVRCGSRRPHRRTLNSRPVTRECFPPSFVCRRRSGYRRAWSGDPTDFRMSRALAMTTNCGAW